MRNDHCGTVHEFIQWRMFSRCPDWITGGLGSQTSQPVGFFSFSFMNAPSFADIFAEILPFMLYRGKSMC